MNDIDAVGTLLQSLALTWIYLYTFGENKQIYSDFLGGFSIGSQVGMLTDIFLHFLRRAGVKNLDIFKLF